MYIWCVYVYIMCISDIVQFVLVIRLDGTFDSASRRKRFTAQDLQNLVAMVMQFCLHGNELCVTPVLSLVPVFYS